MKFYKFYWKDGRITESSGETPAWAFSNAGFGGGAMAAVDFYTEDEFHEKYYYDKQSHKWNPRRKIRFTMARPEINAKIQAVMETTHVIDQFNPEIVRELVGDLSTIGTIDFNDTDGNVTRLVIHGGGCYLGNEIKKYNYVNFATYCNYGYNEDDEDDESYHFLSNGGQCFPLDNEQDAFEYWLAAAAAGMKTDYNGNPKGSCDFKDIPVYVHQR